MKKSIYTGFLVMIFSCWPLIASSIETTTYYYAESFGSERMVSAYRIDQLSGGKTNLSFTNHQESQSILIDGMAQTTVNWTCALINGRGKAVANLANDVLTIQGSLDGKPFEFRQATGGLPWYQAGEYQLIGLLGKATGTVQEFWVINSEDFRPYKLSAQLSGIEMIKYGGGSQKASKIVISIAGLSPVFWHNDSWYDPESMQYLMFRGRRGAPWTPPVSLDFLYKK